MVFASITFIFFFLPFFLALDHIAKEFGSVKARNLLLVSASLLFYIWGEADKVLLLLSLCIITYVGGILIYKSSRKKLLLSCLCILIIAVLAQVKYYNWIISYVLPGAYKIDTAIPLGISFFTFHAISYLVDISRKQIEPAESLNGFLAYFCMFPHLVAGPIVRFSQVQYDIQVRCTDPGLFSFGMYRLLLGLNKKVLIANTVAPMANSAFSMAELSNLNFFDAWLGITAYTIQIYFDFSGYSDMAIGLAAMCGFRFEENFNRPYSSTNMREFWRRWHISLSQWMRDYLYIPLGGSHGNDARTYMNLFIVFLLCGLWHGANSTFIVWGLWHGFFLMIERTSFSSLIKVLPLGLSRLYTITVILVGWVFFRSNDINNAIGYINAMITPSFDGPLLTYHTLALISLAVGLLLCIFPDKYFKSPTIKDTQNYSCTQYCTHTVLAVCSIAILLAGTRNPFIYFNF